MGRAPCCDKSKVKKGPWSLEEDNTLKSYVEKNGTGGNWISLPHKAGLKRCGKSCRLRWLNYLRPDIKHGNFTDKEDNIILTLYNSVGSRWSVIASHLQGRTDNDVKNYWNTKLKKKKKLLATTTTSKTSTISNEATFDISANNSIYPINPEMVLPAESTEYSFEYPTMFDMGTSESLGSALPKLVEVQENHTALWSPISPSFSLETNYVAWMDNNASYKDGFFMDFAPGSSSCEVLEDIGYQENTDETNINYPNWVYSNFFDISDTVN